MVERKHVVSYFFLAGMAKENFVEITKSKKCYPLHSEKLMIEKKMT